MRKDLHITAKPNKNSNNISYYEKSGGYIGYSDIGLNGEFLKSSFLEEFININNLNHHDSKPSHPGSNNS